MAQSPPAAVRSQGVQPAELLVPHGRAQTPDREPKQGVVSGCALRQGLLRGRMESSSVAPST